MKLCAHSWHPPTMPILPHWPLCACADSGGMMLRAVSSRPPSIPLSLARNGIIPWQYNTIICIEIDLHVDACLVKYMIVYVNQVFKIAVPKANNLRTQELKTTTEKITF